MYFKDRQVSRILRSCLRLSRSRPRLALQLKCFTARSWERCRILPGR